MYAIARLHSGGWANLTIKSVFAEEKITPQEKAFAAAIFYTTAERIITLDYLLQGFLKQPVEKLDALVRAVLETGLCQIKYMDIPPHAAINQMVETVRVVKKSSAAGLVNAVLRKAADAKLPQKFKDETERLSVLYSVSKTVVGEVMSSLPQDYEEFFKASFAKKKISIRTNTLKTTTQQLCEKLEQQGFITSLATLAGCIYVENAAGLVETELFKDGYFHVQGEASQYVCSILNAAKGEKVLDLCAAPGGKSATIAQFMGGGEGLVSAELRENRVPLIEELFTRLEIKNAKILQNDAAVFNEKLQGFDAVLCDVPCSGLGVITSKPDLRYSKGENFKDLEALQLKILTTASRYVKKGGRLLYSTCTVRREENHDVVCKFLSQSKDFRLITPSPLPENAVLTSNMAIFLPHLSKLDGFFVAYLERL